MSKIVLITAPRKTTVSRTAIRKAVRESFLKTELSETVKKLKPVTVTVTFRKMEPLTKAEKNGSIKGNLKKNKLSEPVKKSTIKKPAQKH